MSNSINASSSHLTPEDEAPHRPCPKPADLLAEVADYDRNAEVGHWQGPGYRMTYRVLGQGPPLILVPGIASTYRGYAILLNHLAGRFRTILFDYPGEHPDDGARLRRISHDDLVDDVFGLIEHLRVGRVFPVGLSFGSTIVLKLLHREPRRFPKAAVQGGFARRRFAPAEKLALVLGRAFPGNIGRLPLHQQVITYNNKCEFYSAIVDRWPFYLEQNSLTPIASLAHRVQLLTRLDLRPILPSIANEILLLQGNEDRIVPRRYYDELVSALPKAQGVLLPMVGHQPHYTHPEALAQAVGDFLLPCAPEGCPADRGEGDR
ncbi:alpha/beta fold hydrolase [soil metagenome]